MLKLVLMTTIALTTMAAAPAPTAQTAVAAAQPTAAVTQTSDGGTITPPGAALEEKKICKLLPETGSRMAKRACLTKDQWKKVGEEVGYDL